MYRAGSGAYDGGVWCGGSCDDFVWCRGMCDGVGWVGRARLVLRRCGMGCLRVTVVVLCGGGGGE